MIRYIDELPNESLQGTALIRIDLNTADDWRLEASLPTFQRLFDVAQKVVIISHRGRPLLEGDTEQFSLRDDTAILSKYFARNVIFLNTNDLGKAKQIIDEEAEGSVFLLENVRFWKGEETNNDEFARTLAALGTYYVNDAFAVSHRNHASISAIAKHVPAYGGLRLREEIQNLSAIMGEVTRPFVVVLGGVKLETKLPVIQRFSKSADAILVGGLLADAIHKQGDIGKNNSQIIAASDFVSADGRNLDIGENARKEFVQHISSAKTILWNGPMGLFEDERYAEGTAVIARAIAQSDSFSVAGGGETVMAIRNLGLEESFSFISTGGGAMLAFLAEEALPGIIALES